MTEARLFWCLNGACKRKAPHGLATPMVGYPEVSKLAAPVLDKPAAWSNFHTECAPA